ncbi:OsmC family protein [Sporolactobacillus sp. CPB3-1]|uniref:OsmC family protein n=1 Tax=Sporolactobacillus mangiferae TaxID=2940498 RepID=A0ABT0M882_9BACL|nr:OsmC family protein [Sporolactobacillus mangiferae]MCL1631076.1 OsmC family protein [Sporolactobacillus mangiferae]
MTDFSFTLEGSWTGSWDGKGMIQTAGLNSAISVDSSMSGLGIGTNPDELMISALASCYMITLGIRLKKEAIAYARIDIRTEAVVTNEGGLQLDRVVHHPRIFLKETLTDELTERLRQCIQKAEQDCVMAKAVRGNVAIRIDPAFTSLI